MSKEEYHSSPNRIREERDLGKIKYSSEQEFARLLMKKSPHLIIVYEPKMFEYTPKNSTKKGTLPDFLIVNPNNADKPVYVEITCAEKNANGVVDHKARQKEVMKHAAPGERYVVLYRKNLSNMQRKNPDFNPFHKRPLVA